MRVRLQERRMATGFTLVELLVTMVIGLITVVVIGQVMAVSEERKRSITSGSDTMLNGALALYTLERDIKSAGYGLTTVIGALGCEIRMKFGGNPMTVLTMSPISIADGPAGAPDSIRVLASDKVGISLPTRVTVDHPDSAANFFVESDVGIQEHDLMVAVPENPSPTNWCSLFEVTKNGGGGSGGGSGQGQNQVLHSPGQSDWNHPGGQTIFPASGYPAGSYLVNLGHFLDHSYDIASGNLRLAQFDSTTMVATPQDIFSQIVQLQAVYGKDTDGDCVVDTWDVTQPATVAQWQQLRAVRIALVARSQIPEKEVVTLNEADLPAGKCNSATPNPAVVCWRPNPNVPASGVAIKLETTGVDWQRYRYRVFETNIPVRNLVWLQKTGNPACAL